MSHYWNNRINSCETLWGLCLTFSSSFLENLARVWQPLRPQKSSRDFVSEINLEVLNINFTLHLSSPPASSLLPHKANKGEWKATKNRVTADTKLTARTSFHSSRQSTFAAVVVLCFWRSPQTKCLNMYIATTWFRLASTCNRFGSNIFWLQPINTCKMEGEWKVVASEALVPSSRQKTQPKPSASCCHGLSARHPHALPKSWWTCTHLLWHRHRSNYCHPIQSAQKSLINSEHAKGTKPGIAGSVPVCHQC